MAEVIKINIGRKDVIWNYLATVLQIGSGILLYPLILNQFPAEIVGIWSVYLSIMALSTILDFGFSPSFTRNITYIFSGVNHLKEKGIASTEDIHSEVNTELFSKTIQAMKWFYRRIALLIFLLLSIFGTIYLYSLLQKNNLKDEPQIWISWLIFIFTNTYNLGTLYYDSLISGMGLIKKSKQYIVISQIFYLFISAGLILMEFGLISVVLAQIIALFIRRSLSHKHLKKNKLYIESLIVKTNDFKEIMKILSPNSIKLGITSIGGYLVLQSSVIIGSFYITLSEMASYGITVQIVNVVASFSMVYYNSFIPKIAEWRVHNQKMNIFKTYRKSVMILIFIFSLSYILLDGFGVELFDLLNSKTQLLSSAMTGVLFLTMMLEKNHAIAGGFLLLKNEVPYFKASIISGISTVAILFIFMEYFQYGIWGMILAPGIVQLAYQNWKWPVTLIKELKQ